MKMSDIKVEDLGTIWVMWDCTWNRWVETDDHMLWNSLDRQDANGILNNGLSPN